MRLAFISEYLFPYIKGGAERRFWEIARRLAKRHEVHYYTAYLPNFPSKEFEVEGVMIHSYGFWNAVGKLITPFLFSILTPVKLGYADVYIFNQFPPTTTLFSIHRLPQRGCVYCVHELWDKKIWRMHAGKFLGAIGFLSEKKLYKNRRIWFECLSSHLKNVLTSFGISRDHIAIIPNGVDLKFIKQIKSDERVYGRVIFVGRLFPHKKVDWLIMACKELYDEGFEIELHIVGDGVYQVKNMIRKYSIRYDWLYYHGPLADKECFRLIKSSWVFVLPSQLEGESIVLLEALACGTPVITTNAPLNFSRIWVPKAGGIVVENSIKGIKKGIRNLLDEETWKFYTKIANEYVKVRDWEMIAKKAEKFYTKISRAS